MPAIEVWPVYGYRPDYHAARETVALFFSWGDAASYAMRPADFGGEDRNLYMASSRIVKGNRAHVEP